MSFFAIEGDNGTGKDTLAIKLQKNFGFRIVTNEEDIVQLNKEAKKYDGKKRVKKFLEYGRICSERVKDSKQDAILVRYWISTLAAAYADKIFSYEDVCRIQDEFCSKFYKPDGIICLSCDFEKRVDRIEKRKAEGFDDVTKGRNDRYKWFLNKMQDRTDIKWINIDTSEKDENEVFEEVCKYLKINKKEEHDEER
ncbi:MAG: AAA family ATPase [Clostridia bacterium]|nr:AAA family ATPase [Clostridia bacterium]